MRSIRVGCMAFAAIFIIVVPQGAAADECEDAKKVVKDLPSFNACINSCLKGKKSTAADSLQCLPNKCSLTLTMSPQSAQRACTLGGCQLPRVILDCAPPVNAGGKRFRPSYLLCPIDSKGFFRQFGINTIEVGEDTAADGSRMTMADIEVDPNIDYVEQPLTGPKGVVATSDFGRACNACHKQGPAGSIDNVKTNTSLPIATFAKFAQPPLRQEEDLAPYVIDEQGPNLKEKTDAKVKELGSPVYRGSDPDRTPLKKETLDKICECIKTDNQNAKKIEAIARDKDNATANLPKDQKGKVTATVRVDGAENPDFNESVLVGLCNQLNDYQMKRSCGKDPPEPGSGMACLGVQGGGKFIMETAAVSALTLDVSGNATTTDSTSFAFSFTNIVGNVQAFNYLTHTLIQSLTFQSFTGTISDSGDLRVTGIGVALVNGVITNIQVDAADQGGAVVFQILNLDNPGNPVLAGGTGENGLAALEINSGGP